MEIAVTFWRLVRLQDMPGETAAKRARAEPGSRKDREAKNRKSVRLPHAAKSPTWGPSGEWFQQHLYVE